MEHTLESRIIYSSDQCLVVNKLPGEAVEGAGKGMVSLPKLLGECCPSPAQPGGFLPAAVHRLDVPVSGCVLFARSPDALSCLSAAFVRGRVEKYYWAIIEMPPPSLVLPETGELVHWIETNSQQNKSAAFAEEGPHRKQGIIRYRVKGRGIHYLFLEIELVTGRHHQIRAQLANLGLHIKGDLKYGAKRSEKSGGIRLHARSLRFPNPANEEEYLAVYAIPPLRDRLWEDFETCVP